MDNLRVFQKDLSYVLLPGKNISVAHAEHYALGYRLWKEIWSQTFLELKGQKRLHSDEFMRQDEVTMLLHCNLAIGFFAYNFLNLDFESHRDHSYFAAYPPEVIEGLRKSGHRQIMTMGNLAVHPEWRKTQRGTFVSEILLGLGTKRFLASNATALIAYTRNNRRINDLVYRFGAVPLKQGLIEHNVEVDIILIERDTVKESALPEIADHINYLWDNRVHQLSNLGGHHDEGFLFARDRTVSQDG